MKPTKKTPKTNHAAPKAPPAPPKVKHKATPEDLVHVKDQNLVIAIDLQRQTPEMVESVDLESGQKLFPYMALSRMLVGWQAVSFISSIDLHISSDHPLPKLVVRFMEKMPAEEVKALEPSMREQIQQQIAMVKQFPFVFVESPLLTS